VNTRALPPVRRVVSPARGTAQAGHSALMSLSADRGYALFESGTHALMAILQHCRNQAGSGRDRVLLPAYGCPDLVTATLGAGLKPVLVDTAAGSWGFDPVSLQAQADDRAVAIVAVNLLGCGAGLAGVAHIARNCSASVIEDSAQHLPRQSGQWSSDYQVLSFGKGKPLNLLGGGAALGPLTLAPAQHASLRHRLSGSRMAATVFNVLSHPRIYPWLLHVPGLGVGATVYHPPEALRAARSSLLPQLGLALAGYRAAASYGSSGYAPYFDTWLQWGIRPLSGPGACGTAQPHEPLRLAMLAANGPQRDALVAALSAAGLGATALYQHPLPQISGIPPCVQSQGPFPNAKALADTLFTLPTHRAVNADAVRAIDRCLRQICRERA